MHVTLMADASHCPDRNVAGYGFWIASARGKKAGGGAIKSLVDNIGEAELMALANALFVAINENFVAPGDNVLMQTDSLAAIGAIGKTRKRMTQKEGEVASYILRLAENNALLLRVKHVKGHSGRAEARFVSNHMCDRRAKTGLMTARKLHKEGKIR